ncbi:MAG: GC-type dockerin domain-anchored protein [Planctomycetota bacterium]
MPARTAPAAVLVAAAALAAATAAASAIDRLTIDPAASGFTVTVDALGFSDTQTTTVSGFLDVITDASTAISIADADLVLDNDLSFNLSAIFVGGVTIDVVGLSARLAEPIPAIGVDAMGNFSVPFFLASPTGSVSYSGFGLVGGAVGSDSIVLDPADPFEGSFDSAQVVANAGDAGVGAQVSIVETIDVAEGLSATITITGQVVASGPFTPAAPCAADLNVDGVADFFDVLEFLARFDAMDPAADIAAPVGVFDFFDVVEFLGIFDGC